MRSSRLFFFSVFVLAGTLALRAQAPVANFSANPVLICQGSSVTFTDLSSNSPTSWSWNFPGGTPATSTAQNPVIVYNTAGTYNVTLTATNGSGSNSVTMTNFITVMAPPSSAAAGPDQQICANSTTLAGNTPAVGTGGWIVVLGGGTVTTPTNPTSTVTNLGAGMNILIWRIANDPCPATFDTVRIVVDLPPTIADAGPDQTMCSPNNSTTLVGNTPVTGTGLWTIVAGQGLIGTPSSPSAPVTNLGLGVNIFVWTITNGTCPPSTDTVQITVLAAPNISVNPPNVNLCTGGSAIVSASNGVSYTWAPSAGLSATTGSVVSANPTSTTTYTITGTDANGCTNTATLLVTVTAYPTVTVSVPSNSNVCDNAVTPIIASGASTYTWAPGTGLSATVGSTVNASPSVTTTYTVTGTTNSCTDTEIFTLTVIPAPTATVAPPTSVICQGNNVNLTAGGGVTYNWFPSTGLSATTGAIVTASPTSTTQYFAIAIAANGCSDTSSSLILVNPPPNVSVTPNNPVLCTGDTLMLIATGAINYSWSPPVGLNVTNNDTVLATPSVNTTYTVTGTAAGCPPSTATVTITVAASPTVTITPNNVAICAGSSINLTASGAGSYSWAPSTGLSATSGSVVTATPTAPTTYTVIGSSGNGCTSTAITNININPLFLVNPTTTPAICGNPNSGTATAVTNGGSAPFTYQWNDPFNQTTQTASALQPGTYFVVVTDANGCVVTQSVTVTSVSSMALNVTYTEPLCSGSASGTATVAITGGSQPYSYSWNTSPVQTTSTASALNAGTYTVTVTDNSGCTQVVAVTLTAPAPMVFAQDSSNTQCKRNDGHAEITGITGGTPPYSFQWSTGGTSSSIVNISAGTYSVIVSDFNGCSDSASFMLINTTTPECVFIPNAFSPNGDGQHDLWIIENLDYYNEVKVEIYNRWGNLVYENDAYNNDWDGTAKGGKLPGGSYYYVIHLDDVSDPLTGIFTILR
jgi:gliding motility-associated-like protein